MSAASNAHKSPPQDRINQLLLLLREGKFTDVVKQTRALVRVYPQSSLLWNILGSASAQSNQPEIAAKALREADRLSPDQFQTLNNLGNVLQYQGQLDEAIACYRRVLALRPELAEAHFNLGNALKQRGMPHEALACFRNAAAINPGYVAAHVGVGNVLRDLGNRDEAIGSFRKALALDAGSGEAWFCLASLLQQQGKIKEAIAGYLHLLAICPDLVEAYVNLGNSFYQTGQINEAVIHYQRALAIMPDMPEVHAILGMVFQQQGKLDLATESYRRALLINPDYAEVHNNLGSLLNELGCLDEAAQALLRCLALNSGNAEAHLNLGNVLFKQGRLVEAIECYQNALTLRPNYAEAHSNLGNVRNEQGSLDEAIALFYRALALKPDYAEAYYNIAGVLSKLGKRDEAVSCYRRALALKPDYPEAEVQMLHELQLICDWRGHEDFDSAFKRLAAHKAAPSPFACLALADDPATQLHLSRKFAAINRHTPLSLPDRPAVFPDRLRVGFFGADFHNHATLYLMAGLLREFDTSRFEIFAYSYGRYQPGLWGKRARETVEHFFDVTGQPSRAIAELARSHGLDIAIDLKGYTEHGRLDIFGFRPAPIQISFLGYPGSLGVDFIDYIVADPVVITDAMRKHYCEHVIWLPHSYQPNDNTREVAALDTHRADFGLPEQGIVLCCFNGSYKISPSEFDIWMRVLGKVDGSVLWLLRSNRWSEDNLRKEAVARGIPPERLVFADRADHPAHLARHKHADLFLDTFNVNAHTTASDALWAGLPVVTRAGQQFAARVCASLLAAVGLSELITENDANYEALIVALATDPARLAAVKAKLASNRFDHPLFDTRNYTRHFEAGLQEAYNLHFAGQLPRDIQIKPFDGQSAP